MSKALEVARELVRQLEEEERKSCQTRCCIDFSRYAARILRL